MTNLNVEIEMNCDQAVHRNGNKSVGGGGG